MNQYFIRKNNQAGFTLIELLIVLAIIGLLTTLTVFSLRSAQKKTRDAERVSAVNQLRVGLELGFVQLASYPAQPAGDLALGGAGARVLCEAKGVPMFVNSASDCSGTIFLNPAPQAPVPADGLCNGSQNNYRYRAGSGDTTYALEFCIGAAPARSGLGNGANCATPSGITPGACK